MTKLYIPKSFAAYELVDEETYDLLKHHPELIYKLFDPNVLAWAQWMRDRYGKMYINDWYMGGTIHWRGLRNPNAGKYFSETSMHSIGCAIDLYPLDVDAFDIIEDLKKIRNVPFVTRIEDEDGMTWIHGDTKKTGKRNTYFFKP